MRLFLLLVIGSFTISCAQPTIFSQEALNDMLVDLEGNEITVESVLEKYKGTTVFIDIWASWCRDCIIGMPKVNELKEKYEDIRFVFLTVDHDKAKWKKGIDRFNIGYGDHYLITKGWKGSPFCTYIDLDWIPRYMIIDPTGKISLFKATKATDPDISKILEAIK